MKLLTYLFTLFFVFNAIAVAPYGIKGQTQSGTLYSNVHQFPNNLVTNMGGINALVETGNKNILVNPSFEHAIFSTGWTNSAGTFAEDLVVEIDGLKAAKVTLSAQTLDLSQDSTLYQAQFADGVQGLASVRVKTSVAGLRVCSRQAGVVNSNLCVNVQANGKWGLYKVPFTLGGTSNGISINSNGTSVTGDVYVDDAFVGAVDLAATVDQSRIAGESYFAGTASATCTKTGTTLGSLTCNTAFPGPTIVQSNLGSWQTTDSNLPRQTINNLPAGKYKAKFMVWGYMSGNNTTALGINDGSTTCEPVGGPSIVTGGTFAMIECSFNYNQAGDRSFELYVATSVNTFTLDNSVTSPRVSTKFILEYFGSGTTYSSTNADTDWQTCQFSTLAWQGLGTVSNFLQCKRQGSDLLIRGRAGLGTTSASEARIPLPLWNGTQLTIANSTKVPTINMGGRLVREFGSANNTKDHVALINAGFQYLTIGVNEWGSGAAPQTPQNGSALFNTSDSIQFENVRIPIEGWENSNILIGQFNGLESCTDTYQCTDTFSAKISSAGVVSDENLDFISGNCTIATNSATCTFRSGVFTVTPNCVVATQTGGGGAISGAINPNGTTGFTAVTYNTAGSPVANDRLVVCQKQGVDYIGKTAKAVASDQNISTPGTIKSTLCSAKISSTGVISDQKGGCFASCTNATTPVCTFTSNYWVSGQIPNCWYVGTNGAGGILSSGTTTTTTFQGPILNGSFVAQAADRIYYCHGERP